jgi:hypothetical protein
LYGIETPPVVPVLSSPLDEPVVEVVSAAVVVPPELASDVVVGLVAVVVVVVGSAPPVMPVDVVGLVVSATVLEPVSAAVAPSSAHADRPRARRMHTGKVSRFAIGSPIASGSRSMR